LLPTVMRKKSRLSFYEFERVHDVSVKLLARLQVAVSDEGK
jgi:hypothetical protein